MGKLYKFLIQATLEDYVSDVSPALQIRFTELPSEPKNLREDLAQRTVSSMFLIWD
jgi:hypothetical protein